MILRNLNLLVFVSEKMNQLVLCIGNRDGGDDAVGPYIADKLKETDFLVIDAGIAPENFTDKIKNFNPEKLIIIDALDMQLNPGDFRIVLKDKIGVMHISTHGLPLSVLINYLEQYIDKIVLIGIQPKNMSGEISDIVKQSADRIVDIITKNNLDKIKILD